MKWNHVRIRSRKCSSPKNWTSSRPRRPGTLLGRGTPSTIGMLWRRQRIVQICRRISRIAQNVTMSSKIHPWSVSLIPKHSKCSSQTRMKEIRCIRTCPRRAAKGPRSRGTLSSSPPRKMTAKSPSWVLRRYTPRRRTYVCLIKNKYTRLLTVQANENVQKGERWAKQNPQHTFSTTERGALVRAGLTKRTPLISIRIGCSTTLCSPSSHEF